MQLRSIATLVLVLAATSAQAQLSEVDLLPGSGDAKVTLDVATGLYWLDLPETTNLSVPDVLGGAGGWVAGDWRYATAPEICALFAAYALAVPVCGSSQGGLTTGDVLSTLQGFLGVTNDAFSRVTSGFYEDSGDPALVGAALLNYSPSFNWSASLVQSDASLPNASPNVGNWLVRDSPPAGTRPRSAVELARRPGRAADRRAAANLLRRSRRGDQRRPNGTALTARRAGPPPECTRRARPCWGRRFKLDFRARL